MTEPKTRAEMAEESLRQWCGINDIDYLKPDEIRPEFLQFLVDLLARRDEMVIEECATIAERGADEGPVYCEKPACIVASIRALKGKLR